MRGCVKGSVIGGVLVLLVICYKDVAIGRDNAGVCGNRWSPVEREV